MCFIVRVKCTFGLSPIDEKNCCFLGATISRKFVFSDANLKKVWERNPCCSFSFSFSPPHPRSSSRRCSTFASLTAGYCFLPRSWWSSGTYAFPPAILLECWRIVIDAVSSSSRLLARLPPSPSRGSPLFGWSYGCRSWRFLKNSIEKWPWKFAFLLFCERGSNERAHTLSLSLFLFFREIDFSWILQSLFELGTKYLSQSWENIDLWSRRWTCVYFENELVHLSLIRSNLCLGIRTHGVHVFSHFA